ncbi:MAG: 4Fe-4S dicluster domain-containing protein, partial [Deltaproteobacteria bacterium]|nr:4Fe-4S dicluster domain-containing protein [Deltaproteobacteria bacterium]
CPQVPVIQELARRLGVEKSRFRTENRENTCVLCGLCVRVCREIIGAEAIGFSNRGISRRVGTPFGIDTENCLACGACEYVCPTGTMEMEIDRTRKIKHSATGTVRSCKYVRLGLLDFMICSNGYECWRCEVDQAMEDRFHTHPALAFRPAEQRRAFRLHGFTFLPDRSYSAWHVWAKPMGRLIRLGLDDLASTFAARADRIDLPGAGDSLERNGPLVRIVVGKRELTIPSPLGGKVSAVNHDLKEDPMLVWKAPYHRGWLVMVEPGPSGDLSGLRSGASAAPWFDGQASRMAVFLIRKTGKTTAREEGSSQNSLFQVGPLVSLTSGCHWEEVEEILFSG